MCVPSGRVPARNLRNSPLLTARPATLRLTRIVAVAPSGAVEDQPRGGDRGFGRSAHIQHVWGQGQRLTRARGVDVPQAPVDAVCDAGAEGRSSSYGSASTRRSIRRQ